MQLHEIVPFINLGLIIFTLGLVLRHNKKHDK